MAEVEERISRIKNHKGVKGLLITDENGKVHRTTMPLMDEKGKPVATLVASIVSQLTVKARSCVRDLDPLNDMTFFRVRARKQEIMVAPDKNLFLIVI